MYTIEQLEDMIKCTYPPSVSDETQGKRRADISAVQQLVRDAINENELVYQSREERLCCFSTQAGERVYIQYPGKESSLVGEKKRELDFRPKIKTADGHMVRDLVFADMWGLIETLNNQQHRILKLMAAIFFKLGRMSFHTESQNTYSCELLDANETVVGTTTRELHWFRLSIPADIMESLCFHAGRLRIDEDTFISLEAFLCFFELLLQNEDSKYYDKKGNLTSGRIPTSDSMLLLSANLFGRIGLSVLLQRFVSGFGVARCATSEIESATDGLVRIVDRKQMLATRFTENGIIYTERSYISVRGTKYRVVIKTNTPKVAILSCLPEDARIALEGAGWSVFSINDLLEEAAYERLLTFYGII